MPMAFLHQKDSHVKSAQRTEVSSCSSAESESESDTSKKQSNRPKQKPTSLIQRYAPSSQDKLIQEPSGKLSAAEKVLLCDSTRSDLRSRIHLATASFPLYIVLLQHILVGKLEKLLLQRKRPSQLRGTSFSSRCKFLYQHACINKCWWT